MTEVKRYHVGDTGLVEGVSLGRINVVLEADFDRIAAERDALQLLMTSRDERVDLLEGLLEKMLKAIKRTYQAGRDRIIDLGGDCDGVEIMMNGDLTVQEARTALKQSTEACQFPQSCSTRCDCDIPEFSPGNGNKARRRAEAFGFKIVEDLTLAPDEFKIMPSAVKAKDFHMADSRDLFRILATTQIHRHVIGGHLGAIGATEVTWWDSKIGMVLERQSSNGGESLIIHQKIPDSLAPPQPITEQFIEDHLGKKGDTP